MVPIEAPSTARISQSRTRFLIQLDRIQPLVAEGEPTPLEELLRTTRSLVRDNDPLFAGALDPLEWIRWETERHRILARRRRLRRAIDEWQTRYRLTAGWIDEWVLFTLAISTRRKGRGSKPVWLTPPLSGAADPVRSSKIEISIPGWEPEYETRKAAQTRINQIVRSAVSAHFVEIDRQARQLGRFAPHSSRSIEERNLQWLALRHVYGWGAARIAAFYRDSVSMDGKKALAAEGRNSRQKVQQATDKWAAVIGLSEVGWRPTRKRLGGG